MQALSYRQAECLKLLEQGRGVREIARELGIDRHTVYSHIRRGLAKMSGGRGRAITMPPQQIDKIPPEEIAAVM